MPSQHRIVRKQLSFGVSFAAALTCLVLLPCSLCAVEPEWIRVEFVGGSWPEDLIDSVMMDLEATFVAKGIEIHTEQGMKNSEPVSRIRFTMLDEINLKIAIDCEDELTKKRIGRDIIVGDIPSNRRSLAIAIAADELLIVSWVELVLNRNGSSEPPPPTKIVSSVESVVTESFTAKKEKLKHEVRVHAGIEYYPNGVLHVGGDACYAVWPKNRFSVELCFGARGAPTIETDYGTVESYAIVTELNLIGTLLPERMRFLLELVMGRRAMLLNLSGKTRDTFYQGNEYFEGVPSVHLSLRPGFKISEYLLLRIETGLGYVIWGVDALDKAGDDEKSIAQVSDLYIRAGLTLSVLF